MTEPPTPVPSISPAEMQILVSRAGLVLNPGQVADLVLAWRQVATLISSIPMDRPLIDDMATTFRLPPPSPVSSASTTADRTARKAKAPATTAKRLAPKTAREADAGGRSPGAPSRGSAAATSKPATASGVQSLATNASTKNPAATPTAPKRAPRRR